MLPFNSLVTKRIEACVRNAIAKPACIVWLDRTAIFKFKSSCLSRHHCFLSSQTILACSAIALWRHSSTRFLTGELDHGKMLLKEKQTKQKQTNKQKNSNREKQPALGWTSGFCLKSPETIRSYFGCHNSLYIFATPRF